MTSTPPDRSRPTALPNSRPLLRQGADRKALDADPRSEGQTLVPFRPRNRPANTPDPNRRETHKTLHEHVPCTQLDLNRLDPQSQKLVTLLAQEGARAREGIVTGLVTVIGRKGGISLALGQAPLLLAERLCRTFWLRRDHAGAGRLDYVLTPLARQALQPQAERQAADQRHNTPHPHPKARINLKESPLMWLARRRNSRGVTHISATQLLAGERLRRDYTQAGMTPKMSADLSGLPKAGSHNRAGLNESERMLDARQRLREALAACSKAEADLLLDLCCFLKPLDEVERSHGFRARTGKQALGKALNRLARHYGLSEQARGRTSAAAIVVWKA